MRKGICYIVGAGTFTKRLLSPQPGDFLIAADGGYDSLRLHGMSPDLLLGDMDSLSHIPRHIPRMVFPEKKNDTDVSLALRVGVRQGYKRFALYGISGDRPDHFYANLQLMADYSRRGFYIRASLPESEIYAVSQSIFKISAPPNTTVSLFCPAGKATGVSTQGFLYPLTSATLTSNFPLGVSNKTLGDKTVVSVARGTLLVFVIRKEET